MGGIDKLTRLAMPGPRSRRRRAFFAACAALVVVAVVELLGSVGWWLATDAPFTWSRAGLARSAARTAAGAEVGGKPASQRPPDNTDLALAKCVQHPYLGYVLDASVPSQAQQVSKYGFLDDAPPVFERSEQRFVVAVTGGSLALLLCESAEATLAAALQRSPRLQGRRIELVCLAMGGYKQPQNLLAMQMVMLLGGQFDCVVNVDGFNDVSLLNDDVEVGVPAWFPRSWARLMDRVPTPEQQRRLGHIVWLQDERAARADSADALWWSPTAQLVWLLRDRRLAFDITTERTIAERAAVTPSFAITGAGRSGQSMEEARLEMVALWRRCSLQMHTLCAREGTLYLHFLQPNQYVAGSKPIGAAEAKVAIRPDSPWQAAVRHGYPLLQAAGAELQQAGVAFADLTDLFRDHAEPLYIDVCCHLNHDGYAIVAEHIAAVIRRRIELDGVVFDRLRVAPSAIELTSPLHAARLAVFGVEANGVEHDITGTGFGTRVVAGHAERWVLGGDGGVRAAQRGSDELRVSHGNLSVAVPVVAAWPDLIDEPNATPAADGRTPRIALVPTTDEAILQVQCSSLPPGAPRFLVVSDKPIPTTLPKSYGLIGVTLIPLAADAAAPTIAVPAPPPTGRPLFLRSVVFSSDLTTVMAVSNVLVVTRG